MIDNSMMVYKCLKCKLIFRRNQEQIGEIMCPVCGPKNIKNGDLVICIGPDLIRKLSD